jgi:hypothetical protein
MTGRMPPSASRLQPVHNSAVRTWRNDSSTRDFNAVVLLHQIVAGLHQKTTIIQAAESQPESGESNEDG